MIRMVLFATAGAGALIALSLRPQSRPPESATPVAGVSARQNALPPRPEPRTDTLRIEGMTCGGCVLGTRKVLTRLDGVTSADVSYERAWAIVTYDPRKVTVEQMIAAIRTLGYRATPMAPPRS